jgi:2',3'-cyclic-nucleotide 2'-phosphodiesterase (5'-nucleotidase family)
MTVRGVISVDSANITKPDSLLLEMIKPYKTEMELKMNEVLAYSEKTMVKQQPEGILNNFVTDLMLKESSELYKAIDTAKIDICLFNNGGLRNPIAKGAITLGSVYQLMPFENMVTVLTISGSSTKKMFEYIAKKNGMPVSGARLGIKNDKPVDILINGSPLDTNRNYRVVTSDYLADGGDNMDFLINPVSKKPLNIKLRDMIIDYLRKETALGRTINVSLDKRIYYAK